MWLGGFSCACGPLAGWVSGVLVALSTMFAVGYGECLGRPAGFRLSRRPHRLAWFRASLVNSGFRLTGLALLSLVLDLIAPVWTHFAVRVVRCSGSLP